MDRFGNDRDVWLDPIHRFLLHALPDSGQRLDAVASVVARGVDLVSVPLAIGQPLLMAQQALGGVEQSIELGDFFPMCLEHARLRCRESTERLFVGFTRMMKGGDCSAHQR